MPVRSIILPVAILLSAVVVVVLDRTALLDPPAYTERGLAAFEQGDWVEAIDHFAQAQKHCETDILARRMLGMSYHNYGWNDDALRQYEDTWTLFSQNAALAMRNAGRLSRERGSPEQAFEYFQRALRADPNFAGVWADLAELQASSGNGEAARDGIDRAVEIEPENPFLQELRKKIRQATSPPDPGPTSPEAEL